MVSLFRGGGRNVNEGLAPDDFTQMLMRRMDYVEYERMTICDSTLSEHDIRMKDLERRLRLVENHLSRDVQRRRRLDGPGNEPASAAHEAPDEEASPTSARREVTVDLAHALPQQTLAQPSPLPGGQVRDNSA